VSELPKRRIALALVCLAALAAAPGIKSGFVYDDVSIIANNPLVHDLRLTHRLWSSPYWPAGLLYRPLTVQLFAVEWAAGGGQPLIFHLVSAVLLIAATLLLWRLTERVLPGPAALVAAALFAVHPVHVESVANVVGQAELLAAIFTILCLDRYIVWRIEGPLSGSRRAALAAFTLLAILSKETGYVVPALLVAAEVTVVRSRHRDAWHWRQAMPVFWLQVFCVMAAVLLRIVVLGFSPGAGPSLALRDLTTVERAVGMLSVVPEWMRLLAWPARLQGEYGPPALAVTAIIGREHLMGLLILVMISGLLVWAWRRAPAAALAIVWILIALFPVSNVLTPTGVILAERTLFLPSAGFVLAVGTCWAALGRWSVATPGGRTALLVATTLIVGLGLVRSATRSLVWRDQDRFFSQLVLDAPTTYRAHMLLARHLAHTGRAREAEVKWRRAFDLYQGDPEVHEELGQIYRARGRCDLALPVFESGLARVPDRTTLRSRYIECLLTVGDTARALALANEAVRAGYREFEQTARRLGTEP
jgi:hypothetical protein